MLTTGINIEQNLKRLAEYRNDIFGTGAEETLIGTKKGEEETRIRQQLAEESIIGKIKPINTQKLTPRTPTMPRKPSATEIANTSECVMSFVDDSISIEPSAKKRKTADDFFMLESEFLALKAASGPVKFYVQCPQVPDKPEWNLNGQRITLELELNEPVLTIKHKLMQQLQVPISKQKLLFHVCLFFLIIH